MRVKALCAGLVLTLALVSVATAQNPPETWQKYKTPEEAGWSSLKLAEAEEFYDKLDAAAFLVVYDGKVLVSWGDIYRRYMCHSVRKSFLSALYGTHVDDGSINIDKTLMELNIDDKSPLTDAEKQATVRDLLKARSGVYHPAAYETEQMKKNRPQRGSHKPNTFWYYNNWDFNALCTILEQETGADVFADFNQRLAVPLQMEDFRLIDGYHHYEEQHSIHPAYPFRMSARDMARFGQLFLVEGRWNGQQIVSREWVEESTRPHSDVGKGTGYGYMWWTEEGAKTGNAFYAQGYGGHVIGVLPQARMVVVQRVDTFVGKAVPFDKTLTLIGMVLGAKVSDARPDPDLIGLPPLEPVYEGIALDPGELSKYVRVYPVEGHHLSVERYEDGLLLRSSLYGNYRLFPLSGGRFFVEDSQRFAVFEFEEHEATRITMHSTAEIADLYQVMVTEGIDLAVRRYHEVEEGDPGSRVFGEQDLNILGYELLQTGRTEEAIAIFRLNVSAYPESFNTYDSLGEAYMAAGDFDSAVKNYRKSLELNPDNVNAEEMLTRIENLRRDRE